jgi:hypothetical protein
MSTITFHKDAVLWPDYRVNISGTGLAGPDPAWMDYPALVMFQELASCGRAGLPGETARLTWDDLVAYASGEGQDYARVYHDLGLPEVYNGPLFLESSGAVGVSGFSLRLLYPDSVTPSGPHGNRNLRRQGLLLQASHQATAASCSPAHYRLASAVDAYMDTLPTGAGTKDELLLGFARIRALALEASASVDETIRSENVVEAGRIRLILEERGEGAGAEVSVKPAMDIPGLPPTAYTEKFDRRINADAVVNFDRPGGGRIRTVLDKKKHEAVQTIKERYQKIKNFDELRTLIDNPPAIFDEADIDVNELYSERVKGLGFYHPKAMPFICPYRTEWIPGIILEGVDSKSSLTIKTDQELADLENAISKAEANKAEYIEFGGERIAIDAARQLASAARLKRDDKSLDSGEAAQQAKVLLIDENIEELAYREADAGENIEDNVVEVPGLDPSITLKPYQHIGIARLVALFGASYPGMIIADDMGLGKTLQALAFLEYLSRRKKGILACIVTPKGLIGNWMGEYRERFPNGWLVVDSLMGDKARMIDIKNNRNKYDNAVFLFSYVSLRRNQLDLCAIQWDVAILDEAHRIKTPGTLVTNAAKALNAKFKVAMTGTPVENSYHVLWCIADFAMPGFLGSARSFAKEYNPPKGTVMMQYGQRENSC